MLAGHHRRRSFESGGGIDYLFNATAAAAADQVLLNGQLLDTAAEGMLAGSATAVSFGSIDPASRVSIVSGRFEFTGNSVWNTTGLIGTSDLPDALGRVWKTRCDIYVTSTPFGVQGYRIDASVNLMQEGIWGSGLTRVYNSNAAQIVNGTFPSIGTYDLAMISKGGRTGFKYLVRKVGAETWDHFVTTTAAVSVFFPSISCFRGTHKVDYHRVTETLFPDMITGTDYSDLDSI